MNKLVIDNLNIDSSKKEKVLSLQNDTFLTLQNECELYIELTKDLTLDVVCSNKANLHIFSNNHHLTMNVELEENGDLEVELSLLASKYVKSNITITHHHEKTKSQIDTHGISYGIGFLELIVTGIVPKGIVGCICNQASQIINLNHSESKIAPNLFIDDYDVIANHAAYIGDYPKNIVFYLQTKGIMMEVIYQLLSFAFLKQHSLNNAYNEILENYLSQILLGGDKNDA